MDLDPLASCEARHDMLASVKANRLFRSTSLL